MWKTEPGGTGTQKAREETQSVGHIGVSAYAAGQFQNRRTESYVSDRGRQIDDSRIDADLARVIDAWPTLPETVRQRILDVLE
jgi:hypothetical protein